MQFPFPHKTLARCVALALVATPAFAGEIQSIDLSNTVPNDSANITTIYDRDPTLDGAVTYGEISWDEVKAVLPGIAVYNNVPPQNTSNQIYADCVMAPRVPSLIGPGIDKACNDGFQTHKRYKMNATSIGPIDLVFKVRPNDGYATIVDKDGNVIDPQVDQDPNVNVYRMIGKLNNHTAGRLGGFKIQLGFGIGDNFTDSTQGDGLKIRLYEEGADPTVPSNVLTEEGIAEFPGGLFYGPQDSRHDWGFFSETRAFFLVDTSALDVSAEDTLTSGVLSTNYASKFGEWLPLSWAPPGWFFDDDANPATDAVVKAWFDGTNWLTYDIDPTTGAHTEKIVDLTEIANYVANPPTVYDDDGVNDEATNGGTLFATWDAKTELYTLASDGSTITNEEMVALIAASSTLETRTGYQIGPIEDLANVNLNYFIEVGDISTWTTGNSSNDEKTFTLRITPMAATDNTTPAWVGVEPPIAPPVVPPVVDPTTPPVATGGDGGCTMATGKVPFDPTLPLLLAGGVAAIALRRRASR